MLGTTGVLRGVGVTSNNVPRIVDDATNGTPAEEEFTRQIEAMNRRGTGRGQWYPVAMMDNWETIQGGMTGKTPSEIVPVSLTRPRKAKAGFAVVAGAWNISVQTLNMPRGNESHTIKRDKSFSDITKHCCGSEEWKGVNAGTQAQLHREQ